MHLLVTAGNTLVPIDRVRCLTNRFTGRTGAAIAQAAHARGHSVSLLTSHPNVIQDLNTGDISSSNRWKIHSYQTFQELHDLMRSQLKTGIDGLIHSAAVSDYLHAGIYAPAPGTSFNPNTATWHTNLDEQPKLMDCQAGKVKSNHEELWLRMTRAPKLVDLVRSPWGFTGILVKFKLEVGIDDAALLEVAEQSRLHSQADLMVANTLESSSSWAAIGAGPIGYQKVSRSELPTRLLEKLEQYHQEQSRG